MVTKGAIKLKRGFAFLISLALLTSIFSNFVSGFDTGFLSDYPSEEYYTDDSCFKGCVQAENACRDKADADYSACDPIRAGFGGDINQYNCYVEYRKKTILSYDYHYAGEPEEGSCAVEGKNCVMSNCIKQKPALAQCGKGAYQSAEDYCRYEDGKDYSYKSCIDVCQKQESAVGDVQDLGTVPSEDKLAEEVAKYTAEPEPLDTKLKFKEGFFEVYEDTGLRFAEGTPIPAGNIDQLKGIVEVQQPDGSWKKLAKGDTINSLDRIRTSSDGRLKIILKDGTVFQLGGNSDLIIDEFVYDPNAKTELSVRLAKGLFRWITEKVARKAPSRVNIKLPIDGMATRGTDFIASYDPATDISEVHVFEGEVDFTSEITGETTTISEGNSRIAYFESADLIPLPEDYWNSVISDLEISEAKDESGAVVLALAILAVIGILLVVGFFIYIKFVKKK